MGKLIEIQVDNFKSYKGQHVIGPFSNFTAVIGPNGSGKSNLMDAISFVLGVQSGALRSSQLKELIYRSGRNRGSGDDEDDGDVVEEQPKPPKKNGSRRSEKEDNEEEDGDDPTTASVTAVYHKSNGKELLFTRSITETASSEYRINGRVVTFAHYLKTLEGENILVKARNFLVFQGDVEAIASQSSKDLTRLIEQISGSLELKPEYERLKALQEKATETSSQNFSKKRGLVAEMKQFKEQKEEADRYNSLLQERVKLIQTQMLYKLFTIENDMETAKAELDQERSSGSEFEHRKAEIESGMKETKKLVAKATKEVLKFERVCKEQQQELDDLKPDQLKVSERVQFSEKKLKRVETNLEEAQTALEDQTKQVKTLEKELKLMEKAYATHQEKVQEDLRSTGMTLPPAMEAEYKKIKGSVQRDTFEDQERVSLLKKRLKMAKEKQNQLQDTMDDLQRRKDALSQESALWDAQRRKVEEIASRTYEELKTSRKQLHDMDNERRRLTQLDSELNEKLADVSNRLLEARVDQHESNRQIQFRERLEAMKRLFSGVHGRLMDLCRPAQSRYDTAVATILGKHMDAIVVDSEETAIECIQYLKEQRAGQATFLPLATIVVKPVNEKFRTFAKGVRLAIDCIETDKATERAVLYACGNAVICDNLQTAKYVVYERHQQVKAVTLDGTVIHKTGMITGGRGQQDGSRRWEQKDIEMLKSARENLVTKLADVSKARRKAEQDDHLFAEVSALESKLATTKDELKVCETKLSSLVKEISHLDDQLKEKHSVFTGVKREADELESDLETVDARLQQVENRAFVKICAHLGISSIREYEDSLLESTQASVETTLKFTTVIAKLRNQLELETQRQSDASQRVIRLEEAVTKDSKALAQAQKEQQALLKKVQAIEDKRAPLESSLEEAKKKVEETNTRVGTFKEELADLNRVFDSVSKKLSSLESKFEGLRADKMSALRKCKLEEISIHLKGTYSSLDEIPLESIGMSTGDVQDPDAMELDQPVSATQAMNDIEIDFKGLDKKYKKANEDYDGYFTEDLKRLASELEHMAPNVRAVDRIDDVEHRLKETAEQFEQARLEAKKAKEEFMTVKQERYRRFHEAFTHISSHIDAIYKQLTTSAAFKLGGTAYLSLEDSDEPYLDGVKYHAMPPMKRFREMELLSGGEKTVAALALLFAIHSYRPSPFFVLDEVDAALDNTNVIKVMEYIQQHSRMTDQNADSTAIEQDADEMSEEENDDVDAMDIDQADSKPTRKGRSRTTSRSKPTTAMKKKHGSDGPLSPVQFVVISLKSLFYQGASSLVGIYRDVDEASSQVLTLDLSRYE